MGATFKSASVQKDFQGKIPLSAPQAITFLAAYHSPPELPPPLTLTAQSKSSLRSPPSYSFGIVEAGLDLETQAVSTKEKESYYKFAIQNLHSIDPFADASKGDDLLPAGTEDYIHIRIQQRNGRKTLTTVQGIADDYDKKKLVKALKSFACSGTVIEHPEYGEVIQPQGDQCKNICQFLIELGLAKDDQLKVHGF
ncbi:eukaryotic translation initiation factor 1-like [Pongo pygmaeus]|uniref:eukaryotic translation initiation factor 1-like n=1 Tax=Pongo pygmaeus TaxID=9600 RepID=UPI0023E109DF|nr:eukaryotic translation initiation factor 1-like [Pongo pygmaeus]